MPYYHGMCRKNGYGYGGTTCSIRVPLCEVEFINLVKVLQEKDNKKKVELYLEEYMKCKGSLSYNKLYLKSLQNKEN